MSRRRPMGRGATSRRGLTLTAVALVASAAFAAGWWLGGRDQPAGPAASPRPAVREQPVQPAAPPPAAPAARTPAPLRVQPPTPAPPRTPEPRVTPSPGSTDGPDGSTPRASIVFDDAGGSLADVEQVIAIGRPVAVAVLPHLRYSADVARRAEAAGLEVLLHLPVEADNGTKALGPGGVTVAMSDVEIRATVRTGLDSVPGAIGVNNHMGSKGTADRRVMRAVLEAVRDAGLFFIDSRTTLQTVAPDVAEELGVRIAARAVFLDNEDDEAAIRQQVHRLIEVAKARGSAIAIGHAQRLTPRVVAAMVAEFDRAGVVLVPVSTLVK